MADLKAQIEITTDATGVEAGIGKAKRSLADLGAAAQTAGKQADTGLSGIGAGAEKSAAKVRASTRTLVASIERTTVALDSGGRSSRQYYELLASQRGINTSALKPYLDQLDSIKTKQTEAAAASLSSATQEEEASAKRVAAFARLRDVVAQTNYKQQIADQTSLAAASKAAADAEEQAGSRRAAAFSKLRDTVAQTNYKEQIAEQNSLAVASKAAADAQVQEASRKGAAFAKLRDTVAQLNYKEQIANENAQTAAIRKSTDAQKAFVASLREQVAIKGLDAKGLLQYRAAQLGVSEEAGVLISKLGPAGHGMEEFGFKTAAAKRELLVLGHELSQGNFSRFGSSLLVLGERTGAAAFLFSATALTVGVLTAAVAALAYAYGKGAKESDAYAKALILSGNAAGTTVGQLNVMAQSISSIVGTQGKAAETLAEFAQSGEVAADSLQKVSQAAIRFERDTGQAVSETVKQFAELGRSPVEASIKLNDSLNYLTLTTYRQIKALEDAGRATDAAKAAQDAYADALTSRSTQIEARLGYIERAWLKVKDATKGAIDAALGLGRAQLPEEQIAAAQKKLAGLNSARGPTNAFAEQEKESLKTRIGLLQLQVSAEGYLADATKKATDQVKARIQFDKDGAQFLTNQAKMEREITKARNEGAAAGASQVEIEKRIADIRAKYTPKGAAKSPLGIDKAQLGIDIALIESASARLVGIYKNQDTILEAQRSAGSVSESEYYQKKRENLITEAEIQDYSLQQEIKRYQQEKLTGKEAIDNAKKIAEAEGKLAILRADTSAKLAVLGIQEGAAAKKLALAYLSARQAAQDYYDTIQRQRQRELGGIGQGAQKRQFDSGVSQIEDRYAGQRRDLENEKARLELEGKFTDDAREQYKQRLAIINEFQAKSISSYAGYYAELMKKQGDFSLGANEALQNYQDEAKNAFALTEHVVSGAFRGMEDSLTSFITTGKGGFKALADSIAADIVRISVKQQLLAPLSKYLQGLGRSGSSSEGDAINDLVGAGGSGSSGSWVSSAVSFIGGLFRAGGGPVSAGGTYIVGEKGPEVLRIGAQAGHITPNDQIAANGSQQPLVVSQTFVLNQPASKQTQTQVAAAAQRGLQLGQRNL